MTLELLFAREAQTQCFLLMALGALLLGALGQLAGALGRRRRGAGVAADTLLGLLALALLLAGVWLSGGLRLYLLLGLTTGLAVYLAGVAPLISWIGRYWQKTFPPQAGKTGVRAESSAYGKSAEG